MTEKGSRQGINNMSYGVYHLHKQAWDTPLTLTCAHNVLNSFG
jgi:hypothetical protein